MTHRYAICCFSHCKRGSSSDTQISCAPFQSFFACFSLLTQYILDHNVFFLIFLFEYHSQIARQSWLRAQVGVVQQHDKSLMSGTIRDNIEYGKVNTESSYIVLSVSRFCFFSCSQTLQGRACCLRCLRVSFCLFIFCSLFALLIYNHSFRLEPRKQRLRQRPEQPMPTISSLSCLMVTIQR